MHTSEAHFPSTDGTVLFERAWHPDGQPKAAVLIIHGYAEHSGRYDWTARRLVARGYAVFGFDLRGHGKSDGDRVFIRSMNEYLDDVDAALARVLERDADLPVFLLGHSMGGSVLALYACARIGGRIGGPIPRGEHHARIEGLIFSGAVLPARGTTTGVLPRLMMLLGRFFPNLRLRSLAAATVSRDPAVVADYDSDPLNYRGKMPLGLIASMIRGGRFIESHMSEIELPLLILHGSADQLVAVDGSQLLYEAAASRDKTLKIYEGLFHEILNEPEKDLVIADIVRWLDRHVAADTSGAAASAASM
ncbi:MAG: lysophospholipase [Chloroflexi bacterium]|nr:lysophospholipase [Chloroflexota bacterium]